MTLAAEACGRANRRQREPLDQLAVAGVELDQALRIREVVRDQRLVRPWLHRPDCSCSPGSRSSSWRASGWFRSIEITLPFGAFSVVFSQKVVPSLSIGW